MKKLFFLFLVLLLLGFNYSCSKKNDSKKNDSEETIKKCEYKCSNINDPDFCKRVCEKEIFDLRWEFLGFNGVGGLALFYDSESIFISDDIVNVWGKIIYSEKAKQDVIRKKGTKYKKLDKSLFLLKIDCSKRRVQLLEKIDYALDGSILDRVNLPEFLAEWVSIPPGSIAEKIFEEICVIENTTS